MSFLPAPHPPKFRRRAVELARERARPIADIAESLNISESCLRNWMTRADTDDGLDGGGDRLTSKERVELAELRKEKRRLEVENWSVNSPTADSTSR